MKSFKTYLEESTVEYLEEAIDYKGMFKQLLSNVPEKERIRLSKDIDNNIKKYKAGLKKSDRIVWFLKQLRLSLLGSMTSPYSSMSENIPKSSQDKLKILFNEYSPNSSTFMNRASLLNFYDSMEHFLSLSIPEIQNYQWNNQSSEEIQNYFIRLEDEWKSNQKQLIPFSEDDTIIKKMNNNFYWVDLETSYCKKEGASMGHCGNSPRSGTDDTIYSLRELKIINGQKYWHPFVTITVDDELMVWETKGRGNQKPASRYIPYVVELFKDKNYIKGIREGVGYLPENNLRFEKDFTDEQQNEIEEANPDFEIAKKLPLVLIYDEIATAQEIMSENGVEDNLEYAYRDRGAEYEGRNRYYRADDIDDDEYDDIYNNAAIYRVTDYDEVLKYCYEIYENESGGRYYEEDRRFENLVSFFSNPWGNPDDKDIAKQAVYDFFDNANETFIEYKDDYGSEPVDEDDRDEFLLNVVKDFNEEYKTLIKFCETLEEEFPFTFNWELGNNDIPRTYKNPDQLEFKFESYKNILKHYEVL